MQFKNKKTGMIFIINDKERQERLSKDLDYEKVETTQPKPVPKIESEPVEIQRGRGRPPKDK
jgi:hypothetical protein